MVTSASANPIAYNESDVLWTRSIMDLVNSHLNYAGPQSKKLVIYEVKYSAKGHIDAMKVVQSSGVGQIDSASETAPPPPSDLVDEPIRLMWEGSPMHWPPSKPNP